MQTSTTSQIDEDLILKNNCSFIMLYLLNNKKNTKIQKLPITKNVARFEIFLLVLYIFFLYACSYVEIRNPCLFIYMYFCF